MTERIRSLVAKISPLQYVVACLVIMFVRPASFMVVGLTVAIVSHAVLMHAAFLDIMPTLDRAPDSEEHVLMRAYRRGAQLLLALGLVVFFVEVPTLGAQTPGLLVATATGLILAVKMISFSGTDAR